MNEPVYFDDLQIGHRWRSTARTVTESDVSQFAGLTGDFDPLHTDHEFARNSPFRQPIAHGLLGMSIVAGLGSRSPWVHTAVFVGVQDWRFLKPIYFGDTVHVLTEVVEKMPKGRRRGMVVWKRQLINQRDEVVQEGFFETLVEISPEAIEHASRQRTERRSAQPESPPTD